MELFSYLVRNLHHFRYTRSCLLEIDTRYTVKHQSEQQVASVSLKRSMTERERESEVIEIDTDITAPGATKKTNRTVTDLLIKKTSHEDFVVAWSEAVLGKGLTFDFFSDPLVHKDILVTVQCADSIICMPCSWHGGMRFTHLCTVLASSWTKHSAACNMTMRRERTFSKSWRLFLK